MTAEPYHWLAYIYDWNVMQDPESPYIEAKLRDPWGDGHHAVLALTFHEAHELADTLLEKAEEAERLFYSK